MGNPQPLQATSKMKCLEDIDFVSLSHISTNIPESSMSIKIHCSKKSNIISAFLLTTISLFLFQTISPLYSPSLFLFISLSLAVSLSSSLLSSSVFFSSTSGRLRFPLSENCFSNICLSNYEPR